MAPETCNRAVDDGSAPCPLTEISSILRRESRIDELPQLFNILFGDMSLIGPRPLLPEDQPTNASLRLIVRPGLTGWAQINGGNLITPEEKGALDDWYVQKASLWLDLRIALLTLRFLLTGERRSEKAVREAESLKTKTSGIGVTTQMAVMLRSNQLNASAKGR